MALIIGLLYVIVLRLVEVDEKKGMKQPVLEFLDQAPCVLMTSCRVLEEEQSHIFFCAELTFCDSIVQLPDMAGLFPFCLPGSKPFQLLDLVPGDQLNEFKEFLHLRFM
jgi:hypothetical protein